MTQFPIIRLSEPNTFFILSLAIVLSATIFIVAPYMLTDWPFVHDAPLMHYVVFLMDQGFAPYRDIIEMNMPMVYLLERWVMHSLGTGVAAWSLWDLMQGALIIGSSAVIAGKAKRIFGLLGGAFVYYLHIKAGPWDLGQRDWLIATLLVLSLAFLFTALRRQRTLWMVGFALCSALAAAIKPIAILYTIFFTLTWFALTYHNLRIRHTGFGLLSFTRSAEFLSCLGWLMLGFALVAALHLWFFLTWDVFPEFLHMATTLLPWYASLKRLEFVQLVSLPLRSLAILLPLFIFNKSYRNTEAMLLLSATLLAAALVVLQGKGWNYHYYPFRAFFWLLALLEISKALDSSSQRLRRFGFTLLALMIIYVVCFGPAYYFIKNKFPYDNYDVTVLNSLKADLNELGGASLSNDIQCFDMTMGACINTLYQLNLVQATGSIYNYYLFSREKNAVVTSMQHRIFRELTTKMPKILILSAHNWPEDDFSYNKLSTWPEFFEFLKSNYHVVKEMTFQGLPSYRIYQHNR